LTIRFKTFWITGELWHNAKKVLWYACRIPISGQ
jgi:hypothetical protein